VGNASSPLRPDRESARDVGAFVEKGDPDQLAIEEHRGKGEREPSVTGKIPRTSFGLVSTDDRHLCIKYLRKHLHKMLAAEPRIVNNKNVARLWS
jgi:hypothetical protein